MSLVAPLEMEIVLCPCGRGRRPVHAFRTSTRRYVECPACGLVFQSPRPSPSLVEEHYRESYDGAYGAAESSADRQPVYASVLAHLSEWRQPPGRLLDIGCGDGGFMMLCREAGWTCIGIELSQGAVDRARPKGYDVYTPAEFRRAVSGQFDVVTLVNVLEAVTDPAAIVRKVVEQIQPQGIVAVRVLNGPFHQAMRVPVRWCGAQHDQTFHLFSYSPGSLRALLEAHGLEVVSVRNSSPSLGPLTGAQSWRRRMTWKLAGGSFRLMALLAYRLSAGRLVWAPSFELVARRKDGVS